MRVVLVGHAADRDRLRAGLGEAGLEIVSEASSLAAARAHADPAEVDAFVVAPPSGIEPAPPIEALTPRECDVLRLLSLGMPNKVIADRLGISDQTVKFHVAAIIAKLGAANRTDAVRRAVRRGIVDL